MDARTKNPARFLWMTIIASILAVACQPALTGSAPMEPLPTFTPSPYYTETPAPTSTPQPTPTPPRLVPNFKHIVVIIFENKEFGTVIGNNKMIWTRASSLSW